MGTTVKKLTKVLETKESIRNAINSKGGTLTESNKFSDYVTAINNLSSSVDIVKPIYTEQKNPVPNTGHLEKIFFNTKLTTDQVDALIVNANLTFNNSDGVDMYPILSDGTNRFIVIADFSSMFGVESRSALTIIDAGQTTTIYYASPAFVTAGHSPLAAGWNKAAFTSFDTGEIAVDAELVQESTGMIIGTQNNLLTDLVCLYSQVDTGEVEIVKTLSGQYKLVEQNITLDTKDTMTYTYDFANNINEDTKEIGVIKNIKVNPSQEDTIILRNLTTYNNDRLSVIGSYAFHSCTELTDVNFQHAITVADYAFSECGALMNVNIPYLTNISIKAFNGCHSLVKLFISQTDSICRLIDIDAFTDCYHILGTQNFQYNPDGLKDGYIYVPASVLSHYKVAQNWTTYASQIIGHEDLEAGVTLPNYTTSNFTKQTWYSDEKLTTPVTSVTTSGTYYCKLEA